MKCKVPNCPNLEFVNSLCKKHWKQLEDKLIDIVWDIEDAFNSVQSKNAKKQNCN